MDVMINVTLGDISIKRTGTSSGFFIGQKNTHKKFHCKQVINEVLGAMSGNENIVIDNFWVKTDKRWEEE